MIGQLLVRYFGLMFVLKCSEAARILCYQPVPYDSHQLVLDILTEELARQGHQLVVLTTLPRREPIENITEIDVHDISYASYDKSYKEAAKRRDTFAILDHLELYKMVGELLNPIIDLQLNHPQMQALIKDESQRFDLIVSNGYMLIGSMFRARFNAPILLASPSSASAETFSLVGAETNIFFYPDYFFQTTQLWDLSFRQKLCSLYSFIRMTFLNGKNKKTDAFVKKHMGQQAPPFKELKQGVGMLFLNMYHFWDNSRPVPIGSVLYLGGLHLNSPKGLPEDLETFLNKSKYGVVLVNLGSKLKSSTLPLRTLRVMVDVFSQLPYDFIWKWDSDEMPNKPHNVHLRKDMPQRDILHNPNVRALVTHCGLLSTYEAINTKVPLVGLPVFGEQWMHARQIERHGIGIQLAIDSLNEKKFRDAIVAVVEDKKYRDNIARLSRIACDRRESALQSAARWTGRLATRGARLLRSPRVDATYADFFMLDLLLIATLCALFVTAAIVFAVKRIIISLDIAIDTYQNKTI